MSKPVSLAERTGDSTRWAPVQMLEQAIRECGEHPKALVIFLDDREGKYVTRYLLSGMSMSQCVALTEVAKADFLSEMGR